MASLDVRRCSRLSAVHILIESGALASARCSFAYLRSQGHHLGLAKLNSRFRVVLILKNELAHAVRSITITNYRYLNREQMAHVDHVEMVFGGHRLTYARKELCVT